MANDYASNVLQEARNIFEPWRRWLYMSLGIFIVGVFGYQAIMEATAEKRVTKICAALTPGMSTTDVIKFAESHGMYKPYYGSTLHFMGEKATSNNYGCRLEFKHGTLQSSMYELEKAYEHEKPI